MNTFFLGGGGGGESHTSSNSDRGMRTCLSGLEAGWVCLSSMDRPNELLLLTRNQIFKWLQAQLRTHPFDNALGYILG